MNGRESQLAYCGLNCGDCFAFKGIVADMARGLRRELRSARFEWSASALEEVSFFKAFKDYDRCYEVLGAMVRIRCKKACRGGGGLPFCTMRKCCQQRVIAGCWECADFEICKKMEFLRPAYVDDYLKNLRILSRWGVV